MTTPRELRSYQAEAVEAVLREWGSGTRRTAVVLPTGTGKPLHDDTPIPTPGGFTRMGDLRVGSYVIGVDGKPTRVVAVQPQGIIDLFRVRFDDGAELLAGPHHLWTVQRKGRKPRTVTTEWLMDQPLSDGDGYCWRVPVADPAQFAARGLPVDPYLVGSLIANGGMSGVPVLVTPDQAVVDEIARRGVDVKLAYFASGTCPRWTFPGLSHALERAGIRGVLSAEKYIPEPYKVADESARWDLLRGLMDGDGSTRSGGRRSVNYHTTSRVLADDVAELSWSLGVRATISMADRTHEDKGVEYTVHLLPPVGVSLFSSHRRDREESPRRAFAPRRSIVGIDYAGTGPASCITVVADDGLFVAGRRYVVTHNSTVIGKVATESARMGLRVLMLAHRGELLDQMAQTVAAVDPAAAPVGIVRAEQDDPHAQIVAASFQTLANDARRTRVGERQVILCDETHHVTADSYRRIVESFGPDVFFCGFTATLRREDGKALRTMIDSVAYERTLRWAISEGHLVRPTGITVKIPELDLGAIKTVAGDFAQSDLAEVMEAENPEVVNAILKHCADRRPIVFAASVNAAHEIAASLVERGEMQAEAVTGEMPYDLRQGIYRRYRTGATQALVTVMVLTEGADFPMCDAVVIARPTQSQNLYAQMVGRALRLWEGKTDALVVDLVGTARVLKLVTLSTLDSGAPVRTVDSNGDELPTDDNDEDPLAAAGLTDGMKKSRRLGPIDTIGIDLLGPDETGILWLSTPGGVPFVIPPESDRVWFLWPRVDGRYKVGVMTTRGPKEGGWLEDGQEFPLEIAKDIAEDAIIDAGFRFPLRAASWRRTQPPSEAQLRYARSLGIIDAERMTRARLSDEISIALMSARLE